MTSENRKDYFMTNKKIQTRSILVFLFTSIRIDVVKKKYKIKLGRRQKSVEAYVLL